MSISWRFSADLFTTQKHQKFKFVLHSFEFCFLLVSNNSDRKLTEALKDCSTEIPIKIEVPQRSKSVKVKKEELPLNQRSLRSVRSNWECHIMSHYVTSWHIVSHLVTSSHIASQCVTVCHTAKIEKKLVRSSFVLKWVLFLKKLQIRIPKPLFCLN